MEEIKNKEAFLLYKKNLFASVLGFAGTTSTFMILVVASAVVHGANIITFVMLGLFIVFLVLLLLYYRSGLSPIKVESGTVIGELPRKMSNGIGAVIRRKLLAGDTDIISSSELTKTYTGDSSGRQASMKNDITDYSVRNKDGIIKKAKAMAKGEIFLPEQKVQILYFKGSRPVIIPVFEQADGM